MPKSHEPRERGNFFQRQSMFWDRQDQMNPRERTSWWANAVMLTITVVLLAAIVVALVRMLF